MITQAKLQAWQRFRHLPEMSDRVQPDRDGLSYDDWLAIDELVARIRLDRAGLTSDGFRAQTEKLLQESTSDRAVADQLRAIAAAEQDTTPPSRTSLIRTVAILCSCAIFTIAVILALTTEVKQMMVIALMVISFVPYIASVRWIEPWRARRRRSK